MSHSVHLRRRGAAAALIVVALVAAAGVFHFSRATAAAPPSGSVSPAAPSVSWTGGPGLVANPTGTALDAPDCTAPGSCDDFRLRVLSSDGYAQTHQLKITVGWSSAADDFDVYLLSDTGAPVATSASSANPEVILTVPDAGFYTVRVVPFTVTPADTYSATAALITTPPNPAPGTETPPGFTDYAAPSTLPNANSAGEPSIGNDFRTGATMFQSYLSTYKVRFDGTSPARATWTDASASLATGCIVGNTESLDPILFTDHSTGRTFESQLTGQDSATCYTDDDGTSWSPSQGGGLPSGVDHQTLGGGAFAPGGGNLPTTTYPDSVYYCSQDIATAFCASSLDGGVTFGAGVPTYNVTQCGGLHGHVKVGPDGTAYLPNKSCNATSAVAVSSDNGQSWQVRPVPTSTPGDSDPSVAIGSNNTVYFGYVGADGKPGVATSTDHGQTWKYGQTVGTEFGIKNAVFPTMVAGDGKRAALAYLGTPTGGNYQDQATFRGVWHLYVTTTYDGGKTWQTSDATPSDPVQRGTICTSGTTCGNDRNLLDFIDVTMDKNGRIIVGYADGCIDACVTDSSHNSDDGPADAQAAYASIARQTSGKTLHAGYDGVAATNLTLVAAHTVRRGTRLSDTITVKNTGTTTVRSVVVTVQDNGVQVTATRLLDLPSGQSRTFTLGWDFDSSEADHAVFTRVDPDRQVREFDETDNVRGQKIHIS